MPISAWSPAQRVRARAMALDMLDGVGDEENLWHESESGYVLHLRRRLRPDEIAQLDPAFCALPAVDLGGGEDRITDDWR